MFSMTGYGKGEYREGGIELTVEIQTVNHRYLDVSFKSPKIFTAYEEGTSGKPALICTQKVGLFSNGIV